MFSLSSDIELLRAEVVLWGLHYRCGVPEVHEVVEVHGVVLGLGHPEPDRLTGAHAELQLQPLGRDLNIEQHEEGVNQILIILVRIL